jgi:hypothetical protein
LSEPQNWKRVRHTFYFKIHSETTAFGYGATDVFNIKVGPAEQDWDTEAAVENPPEPEPEDNPPFSSSEQTDYAPPVNYPMYMPPYSPFDQPQDPYQVQSSYQMGPTYTDAQPVFAGTPCGQINLSPQQAVFPFNNYTLDSTQDQSPMTPRDYAKSPPTFYAGAMEHSASTLTSGESYTAHTSAPEISDIASYPTFDDYHVHYDQNADQPDPEPVTASYSSSMSPQDSFQPYNAGLTEIYNQQSFPDHSHHQSITNSINNSSTSDSRMYMSSQYSTNDQSAIEGYTSLSLV